MVSKPCDYKNSQLTTHLKYDRVQLIITTTTIFKTNSHMRKALLFFVLFLLAPGIFKEIKAQERYQATYESLKKYNTPDWFRDAKFGIFIHWGVYSVPGFANEWYPRNMYQKDTKEFQHHVEKYGLQNKFGYKDFIPLSGSICSS